jgi:mono/diheme cytochrome c family protein/glucose/arabinose dehydrogenase
MRMNLRWSRLLALAAVLQATFCAAQSGDRPGEQQAPPPAHLEIPPAHPLSPEDALKTLRLAPGFRAELVASEPLLFDPVALALGPDGRMWVVEMRAFMPNVEGTGENAPIGTIAVLEDTNADGRMDRRTEFAGGFVLPRAIALVADGVLVAEPPNLWFLRDINHDGKADDRQLVASDYGNPSNPEHSANGLLWGMDNWIYSANHTTRFRYTRGEWQREATSFRGQWGITQDDFGQLYFNNNSVALYTDVLPAEYLRRNPHLANARGAGVQLAGSSEISVWPGRVTTGVNRGYQILREDGTLPILTAASGPVIYRGSTFPRSFYGDAFICEPAGNLIKRLVIEEREGVPRVRNAYAMSEFITSTDERFRPVNLYNGPDGSMYVVDMYRGVIQHRIFLTTYLRNQIKERALEVPLGMGRIYRVLPGTAHRATPPNLAKASTRELVGALEHADAWVRETAQRLLVEKRDLKSVADLQKLALQSHSETARAHALWTLDGIDAVEWSSVAAALEDPEPRVAAVGARLAERFMSKDAQRAVNAIMQRARRDELSFQRQAALSLGAAPAQYSDPAFVELAQRAGAQPYMADAIVSGLAGREAAFAERLMSTQNATEALRPVLAVTTASVMQAGDTVQMDALFQRMQQQGTPAWIRQGLIDGVDRLIARNDRGEPRTTFISSEPKALLALARRTDAEGRRAAQLVKWLRWRGQSIDPRQLLESLTAEERSWYERGQKEFAICAACHQSEGQGMPGLAPALAGSRWVNGSPQALVRIVLNGKADELAMPSLKTLDDATVSAILTYVRRSWGNEASPISPQTVQQIRSVVANREQPWSSEELEPMR